ncbi:hypothetical protein QTP88_014793 [Uroleucon formosanum]
MPAVQMSRPVDTFGYQRHTTDQLKVLSGSCFSVFTHTVTPTTADASTPASRDRKRHVPLVVGAATIVLPGFWFEYTRMVQYTIRFGMRYRDVTNLIKRLNIHTERHKVDHGFIDEQNRGTTV